MFILEGEKRRKKGKQNGMIGKLMGAHQSSLARTNTAQRATTTLSIPHPQLASMFGETWKVSLNVNKGKPQRGGRIDQTSPTYSSPGAGLLSFPFPICYHQLSSLSAALKYPLRHILSPSSLLDFPPITSFFSFSF